MNIYWRTAVALVAGVGLLNAVEINSPAPRFNLQNYQHQMKALAACRGKVVFVNFWASWCGPCQAELPEISRLSAQYTGQKVAVFAVNVDTDRVAAKRLLFKVGVSPARLQILWDPKSEAVSAFNASTMPSSFVIDKNGIVRYIHAGYHTQDVQTWRDEINRLLTR